MKCLPHLLLGGRRGITLDTRSFGNCGGARMVKGPTGTQGIFGDTWSLIPGLQGGQLWGPLACRGAPNRHGGCVASKVAEGMRPCLFQRTPGPTEREDNEVLRVAQGRGGEKVVSDDYPWKVWVIIHNENRNLCVKPKQL